eukprot:COSAG06_NODE_1206_length_10270_cov_8.055255_12_plen_78_part_00
MLILPRQARDKHKENSKKRGVSSQHLGQITSYDAMLNTIGTAVGPLIFSAFRSHYGSYNQVLYLFSIPPLISSVRMQ